ncbi:hypothetical protein BRADI_5g25773v3 [Brachypodium distachyon]|uniref:Uncharacterized protein n=1 Tax=Brachypodium distachyon TaxID=15368 RepID=A0A2K2CJB2_BRADI|nr:hypothetical protein BRADI_5g25773v3 [Brachypodium distachyon]
MPPPPQLSSAPPPCPPLTRLEPSAATPQAIRRPADPLAAATDVSVIAAMAVPCPRPTGLCDGVSGSVQTWRVSNSCSGNSGRGACIGGFGDSQFVGSSSIRSCGHLHGLQPPQFGGLSPSAS